MIQQEAYTGFALWQLPNHARQQPVLCLGTHVAHVPRTAEIELRHRLPVGFPVGRIARIIHKRIVEKQKDEKAKLALYQETLDSGAQFDMVPIKGGTFTWKGEQASDVLEVTLSPFWMGKHEVTWEEYDPFMYTNIARVHDGELPDFIRKYVENDLDLLARPTTPYHPMTYGMPRDGHPAISMTHHAANKYCQWISYQTGHFYRLPTEAEWEYACRAGQTPNGSWGKDGSKADQYAWFGEGTGSYYKKPGQKKPNAWGLYDMHGNVCEWTLDQYVPNRKEYFGKDKVIDPWFKATTPYPHVVKGGHWQQEVSKLAAAGRDKSDKIWKVADPNTPKSHWYHTITPWLGMRVVRPVKTPSAEEMYHYWNSGLAADEE